MFATGIIIHIAYIYTLPAEQLNTTGGFGNRTAERIIEGIEASKQVPFERVVYALSIPYVGETVAKKLARSVSDIDRLMEMSLEELTAIEDIGPRIAESIIEYFAVPLNREIIERLRSAGVRMSVDKIEGATRSDALAGKSIVISGVFARHSRDEYKELIELHGGKNVASISKKTDYVLAGDNMGPSKLEKATKLGIPIIDENRFLEMIGEKDFDTETLL